MEMIVVKNNRKIFALKLIAGAGFGVCLALLVNEFQRSTLQSAADEANQMLREKLAN